MKYLLHIFAFLTLIACDSDTNNDDIELLPLSAIDEEFLEGDWQLAEAKISDGGSDPTWSDVNDGFRITFLNDNKFKGGPANCESGTYYLAVHPEHPEIIMLILNYDCDMDQNLYPDNNSYLALDNYSANHITYYPTYKSNRCIEGCWYKLKKL